jgi:hypothetical protein
VILVVASVACLLGACATAATADVSSGARPQAVAPATLLPPNAFPHDVQWRQQVTARWPTGTQRFEAVLLKRAGELTMVGLSPLGLPGFVFRLDAAGELHVDNRTGEPLPFEPAYVIADVQRVFFPWLPMPAAGFSGEQAGSKAGADIRERYQAGQLVERSFERDTAHGRERVVVRYALQPERAIAQDAPLRAELDNQLLHYGLVIETLEQERL